MISKAERIFELSKLANSLALSLEITLRLIEAETVAEANGKPTTPAVKAQTPADVFAAYTGGKLPAETAPQSREDARSEPIAAPAIPIQPKDVEIAQNGFIDDAGVQERGAAAFAEAAATPDAEDDCPDFDEPGKVQPVYADANAERDAQVAKRLEAFPWVKDQLWAACEIPLTGKHKGKLMGEVDDDGLNWYYVNRTRPADEASNPDFVEALRMWKAWYDARANANKEQANADRIAGGSTPEKPAEIDPLDFRLIEIHFGQYMGTRLDALKPNQVEWLETEWMPNRKRNAEESPKEKALTDADRNLMRGLDEYAAWRKGKPATNPATTPAVLPVTPDTNEEAKARQDDLKKKSIVKNPRKPKDKPDPTPDTKTPTKAPTEPDTGDYKGDWRSFVLPIGNPQEKGGSKGKELGEIPLAELKAIKERWIDKRNWSDAESLKVWDFNVWDLKRCVEAGILNDGKAPEPEKPVFPPGPLADFVDQCKAFILEPEAVVSKLVLLKELPEGTTLATLTAEQAKPFVDDWQKTLELNDKDIVW